MHHYEGGFDCRPESYPQGNRNGGEIFQGDLNKGTIAVKTPLGNIAGTYNIRWCLAQIEIADKPFLVSHLMIESKIKAYLT